MPKSGYRFQYRKNSVRYFRYRDRYGTGSGSVFDTKCSSLVIRVVRDLLNLIRHDLPVLRYF
ncbi:hypothetical protein Hanom_Chr03g00219681 [Helianthus anomalus]